MTIAHKAPGPGPLARTASPEIAPWSRAVEVALKNLGFFSLKKLKKPRSSNFRFLGFCF